MDTCLATAKPGKSPFARLVAFQLYDGPVSGLVDCTVGDEMFLFRLLAWDDGHHDRVFSLAPVHLDHAISLISDLSKLDKPSWPEWWLDAGGDANIDAAMERLIHSAWQRAGSTCAVVLSPELLREVKAVRVLDSAYDNEVFTHLDRRSEPDLILTESPFDVWKSFVEGS
jgi:hypothetical protein